MNFKRRAPDLHSFSQSYGGIVTTSSSEHDRTTKALISDAATDADVLARDPPGLLVNQQQHGVANIFLGASTVFCPCQTDLLLHDLLLKARWVDIGRYRAGSDRVDGDPLAAAELREEQIWSVKSTRKIIWEVANRRERERERAGGFSL